MFETETMLLTEGLLHFLQGKNNLAQKFVILWHYVTFLAIKRIIVESVLSSCCCCFFYLCEIAAVEIIAACEMITYIVNDVTDFCSESNFTAHCSKGDLQIQTGFNTLLMSPSICHLPGRKVLRFLISASRFRHSQQNSTCDGDAGVISVLHRAQMCNII